MASDWLVAVLPVNQKPGFKSLFYKFGFKHKKNHLVIQALAIFKSIFIPFALFF